MQTDLAKDQRSDAEKFGTHQIDPESGVKVNRDPLEIFGTVIPSETAQEAEPEVKTSSEESSTPEKQEVKIGEQEELKLKEAQEQKENEIIEEFKKKEPKGYQILQRRESNVRKELDSAKTEITKIEEYRKTIAERDKLIQDLNDAKIFMEEFQKDKRGFLKQAVPEILFKDELIQADPMSYIQTALKKEFPDFDPKVDFNPQEAADLSTVSGKYQSRIYQLNNEIKETQIRAEYDQRIKKQEEERLTKEQQAYQQKMALWLGERTQMIAKELDFKNGDSETFAKMLSTIKPEEAYDPVNVAKWKYFDKYVEKALTNLDQKKSKVISAAEVVPASIVSTSSGIDDTIPKHLQEIKNTFGI